MPFAPLLRCKTVGNSSRHRRRQVFLSGSQGDGGTGLNIGRPGNLTGGSNGFVCEGNFYSRSRNTNALARKQDISETTQFCSWHGYQTRIDPLDSKSQTDIMRKRKNVQSQNGYVTQNGTKLKLSPQKSTKLSINSLTNLSKSTKTVIVLSIIVVVSILVLFQDHIITIFSSERKSDQHYSSSVENKSYSNSKSEPLKSLKIGGWRRASEKVLHKYGSSICTVDRKSVLDLTSEEFEKDYRYKKPLIVTFPNGAKDWTEPQKWTVSSLKREYGDWSVLSGNSRDIVRIGGNGDVQTSFTEFVDKLLKEKDLLGEPFYIFDREFYNDSSLPHTLNPPQYFKIQDGIDDSIFFLGASGSGVSFHKHADAWNGVIYGQKRWFLYPVQQTPPGGVYPGFTQIEWFELLYPHLNESNKPIECVQEAGEILYLPEGMYHGTINLGDTLAIGIQKKQAVTQEEKLFYEDLEVSRKLSGNFSPEKIQILKNRRIEIFENLLKLLPGNSEIQMKIGQLYSDYGHTEDGLTHTQKATNLDQSFVIAHLNKGNIYKKMGKKEEAEECYKRALELSPSLWDIHAAYGDFLVDVGRPAEAIPFYRKGTELRPNLVGFWVHLKTAQEKVGDKDGANQSQLQIERITRKNMKKN